MLPLRMMLPVTVPNGPLTTGLVVSWIATGFSLAMFTASTLNPNGSVLSTPLLDIRSLAMRTESQPSLLRSLPVWSTTRRNPPPFWTNRRIAVFSEALSGEFGSGITNSSKLARSSAPPPPYVMVFPGGSVLRLY